MRLNSVNPNPIWGKDGVDAATFFRDNIDLTLENTKKLSPRSISLLHWLLDDEHLSKHPPKGLDISTLFKLSVPSGNFRNSREREWFTLAMSMPALANEIGRPSRIHKNEKPDFLITTETGEFGIEVVEAVDSTRRENERADLKYESRLFRIAQDASVSITLIGDDHFGSPDENDWIELKTLLEKARGKTSGRSRISARMGSKALNAIITPMDTNQKPLHLNMPREHGWVGDESVLEQDALIREAIGIKKLKNYPPNTYLLVYPNSAAPVGFADDANTQAVLLNNMPENPFLGIFIALSNSECIIIKNNTAKVIRI